MDQYEIDKLTKKLGISADQILREEAEMNFLDTLAKNPFGAKTVFYGGTALRLAYGSPRFSENIDLIEIKKITYKEFQKIINVSVKNNSNWSIKDIKSKRQTLFALILIKEKKLKLNFTVKIELHKPAKSVDLDEELLLIKSPTSVLEPLLLVPSLQRIKSLKVDAVLNRKKARDIFDLWYISRALREDFILPEKLPSYKEREFSNELKVYLPKKYYPVTKQLYEKISAGAKKNS